MSSNRVVFELNRPEQIFKNPVMVKTADGGYKNIGYARGVKGINVDEHPAGVKYENIYFPFSKLETEEENLINFLKAQQSFTDEPGKGRLWIYNAQEKAKKENTIRRTYVEAMTYIDSLEGEYLSIKAFAKIGININSLSDEEIKQALYNIADENPQEIIDLKEDKTFDFIGKAVLFNVIELVKGDFYLKGERNAPLYKTPNGMHFKESFNEFLNSKEGKQTYQLIASRIPLTDDLAIINNDDLTTIKGIGASLKGYFHECGITTIKELASHNGESLLRLFEEHKILPPKMISLEDISIKAKSYANNI